MKYITKCGVQIAGMIFQTGSRALRQTGSGFLQDRSSWYSLMVTGCIFVSKKCTAQKSQNLCACGESGRKCIVIIRYKNITRRSEIRYIEIFWHFFYMSKFRKINFPLMIQMQIQNLMIGKFTVKYVEGCHEIPECLLGVRNIGPWKQRRIQNSLHGIHLQAAAELFPV